MYTCFNFVYGKGKIMITSKDNELIKKCIRLQSKKYSREESLCLVESIKLVKELYDKKLIDSVLVVKSKFNLVSSFTCRVEVIDDRLAKMISSTVTTDGVFAICKIPDKKSVTYKKCLVLDRIQDPANMGAIVRTACAFGFDTIFTIDSVYPYSAKTIRSSMGYVFAVNFVEVDYSQLRKIKSDNNMVFYAADMGGDIIDNINTEDKNIALIIGNEGQGVSKELMGIADKIVAIPMKNNVESLNASVSASIIMYFLR